MPSLIRIPNSTTCIRDCAPTGKTVYLSREEYGMDAEDARRRWREAGLVLLLMLFVAGLRCWQVQHTVVTSRDSIAFLHYAWRLERESWQEVIGNGRRHPGYPVAIHVISRILPHNTSLTEPQRLQLTAQI